jgi:hypothetical protein
MTIRFGDVVVAWRPRAGEWGVWKGRGTRRRYLGGFLRRAEALSAALAMAVPAGRA